MASARPTRNHHPSNFRMGRPKLTDSVKKERRAVTHAKYKLTKKQGRMKDQEDKKATKRHDLAVQRYEIAIKEGPTHVCYSCQNLWFKKSVRSISTAKIPDRMRHDIHENQFIACSSCADHLSKGKVPTMYHGNGLDFPIIAPFLSNLSSIEERMVAPMIPFMTITGGLPYQDGIKQGQKKMKGNVITVPTPIDTTLKLLPRLPQDIQTINVHLKRRIKNEHAYIAQQINPESVLRGLKLLITTPLYIGLGIEISNKWAECIKTMAANDCFEPMDTKIYRDGDDLPCSADTIIIKDSQYLGYAPGEGQKPVNLLMTPFAEELCFPTIFGGHPMEHHSFDYKGKNIQKPTVARIIKHQLRHQDKRFANNSQNIFFKFTKQLLSRIYSAEQTQLRKATMTNYSAGDLACPKFIAKLVNDDKAYKFTQSIPSSPAFWEQTKKEVMAMIRQFGFPTLFVTVSPSEHLWTELLVLLKQSVDKTSISEIDALSLSYLEKDRLLRSDPVLVTRYNDERFRCMFSYWKDPDGPFKKYPINNYFYRTEFQAR